MEPNPYASPAEQPVEQPKQRISLLIPLAFIASLFALYCTLPSAFGEGGIIDEPMNWPTLSKLFLVEMVIVATSGIAAFTTLAWGSAKPLSLGRGVCVSHLIVTGVMFSMLPSLMPRAPFFYYHL